MNKRQEYLDLQKRQQEELSAFPIAYAFNEEQLKEALKKLGARRDECVTYLGMGDVMKRSDVPAFKKMLVRHHDEMEEALKNDKEFAEAAFLYEMDNHEYAINWTGDEDVMSCFGLNEQKLVEFGLDDAYRRASKQHMDHAREWDMI